MITSSTTQAPPTAPTGTSASPTLVNGQKSLGKDDFMKLLVTQLSHQDPMSPMESQQFSAQLAQFSSLEQMTSINDNLKKIQDFEAALAGSSTLNLIGKIVNAPGNSINYKSGETKTLSYSLDKDAASVKIDIFDSSGKPVTTLNAGGQKAGSNQFAWNGTDDSGARVPEGVYRFNVTAIDGLNNTVNAATFSSGTVTDVTFENGSTNAIVNGNKVPTNQISRVSQIL